jgi:cytochrome bd-type quinol oxidase subunit 2
MIQRIQTVYLFLASICLALVYFFGLWNCNINVEGNQITSSLKVAEHLPLLVLLAINFGLTLLSIFFFKNRRKQILYSFLSIATIIGFLCLCLYFINLMKKKSELISSSYSLAILLPFLAIVLIVLAIWNIRKDEKLIKSLDRLR